MYQKINGNRLAYITKVLKPARKKAKNMISIDLERIYFTW